MEQDETSEHETTYTGGILLLACARDIHPQVKESKHHCLLISGITESGDYIMEATHPELNIA